LGFVIVPKKGAGSEPQPAQEPYFTVPYLEDLRLRTLNIVVAVLLGKPTGSFASGGE
jgi:hypothetical protein